MQTLKRGGIIGLVLERDATITRKDESRQDVWAKTLHGWITLGLSWAVQEFVLDFYSTFFLDHGEMVDF